MDRGFNLYPSSIGVRELVADSDLGTSKVVGRHIDQVDVAESRNTKWWEISRPTGMVNRSMYMVFFWPTLTTAPHGQRDNSYTQHDSMIRELSVLPSFHLCVFISTAGPTYSFING